MNREDVLRLAQEYEFWTPGMEPYKAQIVWFVLLVAAHVKESDVQPLVVLTDEELEQIQSYFGDVSKWKLPDAIGFARNVMDAMQEAQK